MNTRDPDDPKGLIREAYKIEGISEAECRSILIDWALSLPDGSDYTASAARLAQADRPADHPMTLLLDAAGASVAGTGRRRGGRASRVERGAA
ncbi:hypothetical protein [Pararhodobacter sp. CCB-MM2]|uniref:hypothetical protein n=1 Tax=Pararhodobacter sp. CCB-MM2 TaxID=1786003 RepID=UPI000834ABC8|nr:hypothetical protein [Pararhodobacter sp. CCB-MM2]MCA2010604.1 hypothetical protein [Cereibacter sphaeroides]